MMTAIERKTLRTLINEYNWAEMALVYDYWRHMRSWTAFMRHIKRVQDEKDGDHLRSMEAFIRHLKRCEEVDALKPNDDVRDLIEAFSAKYHLERAARGHYHEVLANYYSI